MKGCVHALVVCVGCQIGLESICVINMGVVLIICVEDIEARPSIRFISSAEVCFLSVFVLPYNTNVCFEGHKQQCDCKARFC